MRIITVIGTAAAAAALTLAFTQPASAATHEVAAKGPKTHACKQTASNGLGIEAISGSGKTKACKTAKKVADGYVKKAQGGGPTTVTVRVGKTDWKCAEVQTETNPFIECVNQKHKGEKVKLFS